MIIISIKIEENNHIIVSCDECGYELNVEHYTEEPYEINEMLDEAYKSAFGNGGYGWYPRNASQTTTEKHLCRKCYIKSKGKNYFIDIAVNQYNSTFKRNLKPYKFSKEYIEKLMKNYKYWNMVEESFCCRGLEDGCWQEVVEEGNWELTLRQVRKMIRGRISEALEILNKEDRFFLEEQDNGLINLLCVLRDTELQHDLKICCSKINFYELSKN